MKRRRRIVRPALLFLMGMMLVVTVPGVLWRTSLSSQIHKRLKHIADSGEPVNASDLAKLYPKVPETENAGLVWLRGVDAMIPAYTSVSEMPWHKVSVPGRGGRLRSDELQRYSFLVASNESALANFRKAAAMLKSHHQIEFSRTLAALMPHLPRLRSATELLQLEAIVAAEHDEGSRSIEAILTMLRASESLRTEPTLIANLMRFRINENAFKAAEYVLNRYRPDQQQLASLSRAFAATDNMTNLTYVFLCERAMYITLFQSPRSIGRPDSKDDASEDGISQTLYVLGSPLVRVSGFFARDFRYYIDAMSSNLVIAALPDPARFQARTNCVALAETARTRLHLLSGMILPALPKVVERDARHRAQGRVAQSALAVEQYRLRYGNLPPTLASLIPAYLPAVPLDPFDGKPLRFRRFDSGWAVYSLGPDVLDDNGGEWPSGVAWKAGYDIAFFVGHNDRGDGFATGGYTQSRANPKLIKNLQKTLVKNFTIRQFLGLRNRDNSSQGVTNEIDAIFAAYIFARHFDGADSRR